MNIILSCKYWTDKKLKCENKYEKKLYKQHENVDEIFLKQNGAKLLRQEWDCYLAPRENMYKI